MLYLSQMMGKPVVDANGEKIGTISDLAISTGEVFPRITSLAFQGPGKVPFMISWRKYVDEFDEDGIRLSVESHDIRFSYLQPDEVLLARDLLNRQIVDTQGLKVVRVNDLKLSQSGTQLRLLGAEVGARGILRGLAPWLERAAVAVAKAFGKRIDEPVSYTHLSLNLYRVIDPEIWTKLVGRVQGANFGAIYCRTKAMGYRNLELPEGHTWKSFTFFLLETLPRQLRESYVRKFKTSIEFWYETGGVLSEEIISELLEHGYRIRRNGVSNYTPVSYTHLRRGWRFSTEA